MASSNNNIVCNYFCIIYSSELKMQKDVLLVHKTELRKILKKFETHFSEKYGR